ncbi:hypothetical protein EUX98_g8478 [Antrodiella citrinella]|uniref:Uncharacterized protein n=1 Tax=Antrodiella citrinella TaxID=2447956 RepID=A0A4S4M6R5_9APHY|nr:hypothetical protein EUX98_g8478 [Antrodiella citrinella]
MRRFVRQYPACLHVRRSSVNPNQTKTYASIRTVHYLASPHSNITITEGSIYRSVRVIELGTA